MPYTALPDRRISYDNDGTVVGNRGPDGEAFTAGLTGYMSGAQLIEFNDYDWNSSPWGGYYGGSSVKLWLFFPEQREVTAWVDLGHASGATVSDGFTVWQGSNNTTNGMDGTWETASKPGGPGWAPSGVADSWRSGIKAISFTGGKQTVRHSLAFSTGGQEQLTYYGMHLYGEKVAGQTPDDLIYINHDDTPGVEYAAPEDFGDRPLATTVTRQFRLKNASATKTANTINIQCNDADFAISTDNSTWVVTIEIGSLAAGAESSTMYIRNTTPAVGSLLGPRFSRIVTTVGSWT